MVIYKSKTLICIVFSQNYFVAVTYMDLSSLRYFYEVSKDLHITNAAKRLYISQQRLSGHIQRLEAFYGVKLIERSPQPHLTAAGHCVAKYAEQMLNMERALQNNLLDISEGQSGTLRIGISQLRSVICLPEILMRFQEKYPGVKPRITTGQTSQFYQQLLADKLDLFIGIGQVFQEGLDITNLLLEKTYMLVPDKILDNVYGADADTARERLRHGVRIEDFRDQPFILPTADNRLCRIINTIFADADVQPNIVCEAESNQLQTLLTFYELGISFLPQMMARQLAKSMLFQNSGRLNLFPLNYPNSQCRIFLAVPSRPHTPRYIAHFRDIVVQVFSDYATLDTLTPDLKNSYDMFLNC